MLFLVIEYNSKFKLIVVILRFCRSIESRIDICIRSTFHVKISFGINITWIRYPNTIFSMVLMEIVWRVFADMGLIDPTLVRMQVPMEKAFILLVRPLTVIALRILLREDNRLVICFFVEF